MRTLVTVGSFRGGSIGPPSTGLDPLWRQTNTPMAATAAMPMSAATIRFTKTLLLLESRRDGDVAGRHVGRDLQHFRRCRHDHRPLLRIALNLVLRRAPGEAAQQSADASRHAGLVSVLSLFLFLRELCR